MPTNRQFTRISPIYPQEIPAAVTRWTPATPRFTRNHGRIGTRQGCMGLSHIHNERYRRYEQQNQGFMTGLESYSVQTIYVTAVNVLRIFSSDNTNPSRPSTTTTVNSKSSCGALFCNQSELFAFQAVRLRVMISASTLDWYLLLQQH